MSGATLISSCRIHPDATYYDRRHGLLTRESTTVFGEPCGPVAQAAPPPGPPPKVEGGAVLGVRVHKKQHNKKLKLEIMDGAAYVELYEDRKVSTRLNQVFGASHSGETWVGYRYEKILVGPRNVLRSRLTIAFRPPHGKRKGFQLLPWAFSYSGDFASHHLLGTSVLKIGNDKVDPHSSVCIEPA